MNRSSPFGHPERAANAPLAWIEVAQRAPYFQTQDGEPWTPIGQNDALTWPELSGLFRRRNLPAAEAYLKMLAEHGVTCLRLMLEYAQGEHRYFERPVGYVQPNMVRLWDDLFALCERYGLRVLLTPFDTFWMWRRWKHHPYNRRNGGPCVKRSQMLLCPETRAAIKARLAFATERWGGSGALFAWDLWNEIHPAYAADNAANFADYVEDVGGFLRGLELHLYERAHPQTVSVFGPVLSADPRIGECAFRHPGLDFASTHFYEEHSIDFPRNTVDAARSAGRLVREALAELRDLRPFFDSEHGPIHLFKDRRTTLPEAFDDEYFRHIQWAHLASGGAGGGMRWPNRHPHSLTPGMRKAQRALARFLPLIDWPRFRRKNLNHELEVADIRLARFACADETQAVVWLLRTDALGQDGRLCTKAEPLSPHLCLPCMSPGHYQVTAWDTVLGRPIAEFGLEHRGGSLTWRAPAFSTDLALAIRQLG